MSPTTRRPEANARVLVTGASSGVGRATALRLAAAGYCVLAAVRQGGEDLVAAGGGSIELVRLDLCDPDSIAACAAAALAPGPLEALVNAAGVPCLGAIEELPLVRLRAAMEVNLFGTLGLCQALAGSFRRAGRGSIVNVSSSLAAAALPVYGGYCATKAALEAATEALRHELAPFGVAVRLLQPGLIATAFGGKRQAQAPSPESPYAGRLDQPEPADLPQLVSSADHVAAVLQAMIEEPGGDFRVTCGEDSRRWIAARRRLDDSDFFAALERDGYAFR